MSKRTTPSRRHFALPDPEWFWAGRCISPRLLAALWCVLVAGEASVLAAADPDYAKQIKPLLHEKCSACHGALKQEAGLRTDAIQLLFVRHDDGPLVVAGKPGDSRLMHAVLGANGVEKMPREAAPLTSAEIEVLRSWIAAGTPGPKEEAVPADPKDHWAFRKPVRPPLPGPAGAGWGRNPIDALTAAEHQRLGLRPMPEAPRRVLLRRVTLDLIGVPPTPDEVDAFLADTSPDAYEKVVDRLLADPRFGQRWGRHWLDVWRYSDWAGYQMEVRESKPGIWRWRDWTVEAINADMPYDQMIRQMLAADELFPGDADAQRATGYLARSWYKFNKHIWMDNTVEHVGKAFLGLTLNCARCHDHKYDPISQEEYYRLRAFFEPLDVRMERVPGSVDSEKDGQPAAFDKDAKAETFLLIRGEEKRPDKQRGAMSPQVPAVFARPVDIRPFELPPTAFYPGLRPPLRNDALQSARKAVASAEMVLQQAISPASGEYAVKSAHAKLIAARAELESVEARLRADAAKYADASAPPADAEALSRVANGAERRAALAAADAAVAAAEQSIADAWIAAAAKPQDAKLSAAVDTAQKKLPALKKSAADATAALAKPPGTDYKPFGAVYPKTSTGRRAALANWIASRENPLTARVAMNHLWTRHTGEPLVNTVFDFGLNGRPATNPPLLDWLSCELMDRGWSLKAMHRLVVTSATYRLASGPTDDASRSAYAENLQIDPDNRYRWRANIRRLEAEAVRDSVLAVSGLLDAAAGGPELDQTAWQSSHRRSLYFRSAQDKQSVFAVVFDAPSPNECYRRAETITPQQALALANSPLASSAARTLAANLNKTAKNDAAFVTATFERVLGRKPSEGEQADCLVFITSQSTLLKENKSLVGIGADSATVPASKDPLQRSRENLVQVLLNHNDFVTVR
jgi:hypothetical protein